MGAGAEPHPGSRGVRPGRLAAVTAVVVLVGLGAGYVGHRLLGGSSTSHAPALAASGGQYDGLRGEATWPAGARPAPAIPPLRDQNGSVFSLASLRGRPAMVTFLDAVCKTDCPLSGRALAAAESTLPAAKRPALVVVSVNPKNTAANARAALREWGLTGLGPVYWLLGAKRTLAPVWHSYDINVQFTKADVIHTDALFLLDRNLDERSAYLWPYMPRFVDHDLRIIDRTPLAAGSQRG
ncbi:MAG: SCO family protein [Solirubrobacteraceae bacterium]